MSNSWINRLKTWIKTNFSQDVPKDISVCEFECRQTDCPEEKWVQCENRKKNDVPLRISQKSR
jgi:hypothetical protein